MSQELAVVDPATPGVNLIEVLQSQCEMWQGVLGLVDWHVHVYPVPANHPKLNDGVGACEYAEHRRDAVIRVCRPLDLPSKAHEYLDGEESDYDLTIVHELLHLHFAPFAQSDETPAGVAQEQAINALSKAVVALHRENQGIMIDKGKHTVPAGIGGPAPVVAPTIADVAETVQVVRQTTAAYL